MTNIDRRTFVKGLGALAGAAVLAGCGGNSNKGDDKAQSADSKDDSYTLVTPGKLTVVAELGFAPLEYMDDKTGEPLGFDVDFAKALGKKLGLETTYLPNQKYDTLIPTIQQGGKADVAIAGFLRAIRAVVALEHVTAVGTTALLQLLVGILSEFVLPSGETSE